MTTYNSLEDGYITFDPRNMPFRRLGSTGLRVPLFSIGSCASCQPSPSKGLCRRLNHQGSPSVPRSVKILPKTSSGSLSSTESTCSILLRAIMLEAQRSSCQSPLYLSHVVPVLIDRTYGRFRGGLSTAVVSSRNSNSVVVTSSLLPRYYLALAWGLTTLVSRGNSKHRT